MVRKENLHTLRRIIKEYHYKDRDISKDAYRRYLNSGGKKSYLSIALGKNRKYKF